MYANTSKSDPRIALTLLIGLFCVGCRVPVIDRGRNIFEGVPALGSDINCPPEDHPGAGCKFGACDREHYGPVPLHGDPLCDKVVSWHIGPDCDGRWLVLERLIGRKRIGHCIPGLSWLGFCRGCEQGVYSPPRTPADDEATLDTANLFFTVAKNTTLDGLDVRNEDIVGYDGVHIAKMFDGSDVGAGGLKIDAFALLSENQILISFSEAFSVGEKRPLTGISGDIDDSDILLFTASSLGEVTRGIFSMYLDGSDIGLTTDDEDIDALDIFPDGRLLVSTVGDVDAHGIRGQDEDLMVFTPEQLGPETKGKWKKYFDGSDVGLSTNSGEDVNGVALGSNGQLYFTTRGKFQTDNLQGGNTDIFIFSPTNTGNETSGQYEPQLYFQGQWVRVKDNEIAAHDLPLEN